MHFLMIKVVIVISISLLVLVILLRKTTLAIKCIFGSEKLKKFVKYFRRRREPLTNFDSSVIDSLDAQPLIQPTCTVISGEYGAIRYHGTTQVWYHSDMYIQLSHRVKQDIFF